MASIAARRGITPVTWAGLAVLAIALVGFWPTFFSNPLQNDLVHLLHGVSATAWVLLVITQSWLVRQRRLALHRRLGSLSPALVALLVVTAAIMVRLQLGESVGEVRALFLFLTVSDLFGLPLFVALYLLALANRSDRALHGRLMAATLFPPIPPALARLLLNSGLTPDFWSAVDVTYFGMEAVLALLIVLEVRRGKLRWPWPAVLAITLVTHWSLWHLPDQPWFLALAQLLGLPASG